MILSGVRFFRLVYKIQFVSICANIEKNSLFYELSSEKWLLYENQTDYF